LRQTGTITVFFAIHGHGHVILNKVASIHFAHHFTASILAGRLGQQFAHHSSDQK
jgi:hypothetical protein